MLDQLRVPLRVEGLVQVFLLMILFCSCSSIYGATQSLSTHHITRHQLPGRGTRGGAVSTARTIYLSARRRRQYSLIAVAPLRAAAAAAAWTMKLVCVAVSHVAASDSNLSTSLPAHKGTESPVCASLRKRERADGKGQPDGVK